MKKILALFVFWVGHFSPLLLYSQTNYTDSLQRELHHANQDSDKVKLLYLLARNASANNNKEAMLYADSGFKIASRINWTKGLGLSYHVLSIIHKDRSEFTIALENSRKAYEAFKSINNKEGMANALVGVANNYQQLGYYEKAIENNFIALRLYEDINSKKGISIVYLNTGISYYYLGNYNKALEIYNKSLILKRELNDKYGIASVLDNIASVYHDQGNYREADKYNKEAIKIFEEIDNKPALARIYLNRGNLFLSQADLISAHEYYMRAMTINQQLNITDQLAYNNSSMGQLYLALIKNPSSKYIIPDTFRLDKTSLIQHAYNYFMMALNYSQQSANLSEIMNDYKYLSEVEEERKNDHSALAFYKQYTKYKDSIFNDENKNKITQLENDRLAEVKDKELQLKESEIKRQKLIKNAIVGSTSVAGIFSFLFIWLHNRRKKTAFDKQVSEVEMKALRSQMNPHFVFNSLHSVNTYIVDNDKENASEYLSKFSKLMRLILENSREQEVPLEDDLSALELYLQLESLRVKKHFQYSIEVDPEIDKETALIPPMLLQPFVENSIMHGIGAKENGMIQIKIKKEDNIIRCTVEDNGIGRERSVKIGSAKEKKHRSLAMKITEERLQIINKLKKVKTAINVFDLKDEENISTGLKVELVLPFETAF